MEESGCAAPNPQLLTALPFALNAGLLAQKIEKHILSQLVMHTYASRKTPAATLMSTDSCKQNRRLSVIQTYHGRNHIKHAVPEAQCRHLPHIRTSVGSSCAKRTSNMLMSTDMSLGCSSKSFEGSGFRHSASLTCLAAATMIRR